MPVYLDNSATTPLCDAVKRDIKENMDSCFGNPSSLYGLGLKAHVKFQESRDSILNALGAKDGTLLITSGGTEANNLALFGAVAAKKRSGNKIISTAVEHPSVLEPLKKLQEEGWNVVLIKPRNGMVEADDILREIDEDTVLLSMMKVNNETGAVFPVEAIAKAAKAKKPGLIVHCDAVQAFLKVPLNPRGLDLISVSAHKLHAPKGVGALYVAKGTRIIPQLFGGGQQNGLRPGTENTLLTFAFAAGVREASKSIAESSVAVSSLRDRLVRFIGSREDMTINSPDVCSPYILNFSFLGIKSETMLHFLEGRDICISSGSACSKGKKSHVLTACGLDHAVIDSALRVSFSGYNTTQDVDALIEGLTLGAERLQKGR